VTSAAPERCPAIAVAPEPANRRCTVEIVMASETDRDPLFHTRKMRQRLDELIAHMRQDIDLVDEPQFKAMFETSAEVLAGLQKAFSDYEQKNESAWRKSA
jgi:hypothetical protein